MYFLLCSIFLCASYLTYCYFYVRRWRCALPKITNTNTITNTNMIKHTEEKETQSIQCNNAIVPYEDKYYAKYVTFPDMYYFTDVEMELEKNKYEELLVRQKIVNRRLTIAINHLTQINEINSLHSNLDNSYIKLLVYFGYLSQQEVDEDDYSLDDYDGIDIKILLQELDKIQCKYKEQQVILQSEMDTLKDDLAIKMRAREYTLKHKLDKFITNYVVEHTPVGEVWMRYNNSKQSFEYFSNNTIPYRYLEVVARKYVMTFWCKPIFINLRAEIEQQQQQQQQQQNNNHKNTQLQSQEPKTQNKQKKGNQTNAFSSIQMYNESMKMPKNRQNVNAVLPKQVMTKMKMQLNDNGNGVNGAVILKEKSNRYTWEGRLSGFSPLQSVQKEVVNTNLRLSFSEYKKMQFIQQNESIDL